MQEEFDHIASNYDDTFTNTSIGKAQRELVYEILISYYPNFTDKKVLEINCGTGADANWFQQKGANVSASDISLEMIQVGEKKNKNIHFFQSSFKDLKSHIEEEKYDLVFSNFGGLNCIPFDEFISFTDSLKNNLTKDGKLIFVIMPNKCWWENIYFSIKLKFKDIFRRNKPYAMAHVEGNLIKTFYHSPSKINKSLRHFDTLEISPVSFFLPPSFLEPRFDKRPNLVESFKKWDRKLRYKSFFASRSDHFLIVLSNKK